MKGDAGDLTFHGGDGSDTLEFQSLATFRRPLQGTTVDLSTGLGTNPYGGGLRLDGVENLVGTFADDHLTGDDLANRLDGVAGTDTIQAAGGNDTVLIRRDPGDGASQAYGGTGRDTLSLVSFNDFGPGFTGVSLLDLLHQNRNAGLFEAMTIKGFEHVIVAAGGTLAPGVEVRGTGNSDAIEMLNLTADTLSGRDGNDSLSGWFGSDTLFGGAGRDQLDGGSDNDLLTGGLGQDLFVFTNIGIRGPGQDTITDFAAGQDRIDLSDIERFLGEPDQWTFIGSRRFSGDGGEVRFKRIDRPGTANDLTRITADGFIARDASFTLDLSGLVTLRADDFVL